jgi:hypothetical protein
MGGEGKQEESVWVSCARAAFAAFVYFFVLNNGGMAAEVDRLEIRSTNTNIFVVHKKFETGDYGRIVDFISRNSQKQYDTEIYFDSPGGVLDEGLKLGRFIRRRHIKTYTMPGSACESACAVAFLGGFMKKTPDPNAPVPELSEPNRTQTRGSKLSFHYFSSRVVARDGCTEESIRKAEQAYRSMFHNLMIYFKEMKVDWSLLLKITQDTSEDKYTLGPEDLYEYDIKNDGLSAEKLDELLIAYNRLRFPNAHK